MRAEAVGQGGDLRAQGPLGLGGEPGLLLFEDGAGQIRRALERRRQDVLLGHVQHGQGLDVQDLCVVFHQDLVAGEHLRLGEDAVPRKEVDVLLPDEVGQGVRRGAQVEQAALFGLCHPFGRVVVAVEQNALVLADRAADDLGHGLREVFARLQFVCKLLQLVSDDGVEHDVGPGDGEGGADGAELELVAGEGKGRGAVAVRIVAEEVRQDLDADLHLGLFLADIGGAVGDGLQDLAELVAQEHGDDGRRGLVGAQAVVVARGGHGDAQQVLVLVDGLDDRAEEEQELRVLIRGGAGLEQVLSVVGGDGPVVVLARAVDAVEGLFVQQADHVVVRGDLLHDLHGELVVVGRDVRRGEDRGELVLRRGDLVVLGLGEDAEFPQLLVQLLHISGNAGLDRAEVVVLHLLPLGRHRAEQRAAGILQIGARIIILLVYEEILLLRADRRRDALGVLVAKQAQDTQRLLADRIHRTQQRGLFVQDFTGIGAERRRDAQGAVLDERIARGVPGGVAARLKGGAQSAGRERGGVRLALDQFLAGKFHDDVAALGRGDEAVVLFRRDAGHRLEPMGVVGRALGDRPVLHCIGNHVCDGRVERPAFINCLLKRLVDILGQTFLHHVFIENHAAEHLRDIHVL